ncbi:MAG TPA: acetylornithine deacetylase [Alphaproteobacteria bacterium]|nr:acetylornithine deacetylase [Alphaproteobacteria bacterium]
MAPERVTAEGMLDRLIGFETVSGRPNRALLEFVRAYLDQHGVATRIVPNADGDRGNLFATIGPDTTGGIALSGHTDVVPVDGQPWSTNPFVATAKDGRIYGRGAADMKSFIAVALSLVPAFRALPLRRPIHLCFSYDEEIGCLGVPSLLRLLGRELPLPALAIIGEPTGMKVVNAHKGIWVQRTTVTGRDGHSSAPHRGANAIAYMARLIGRLEQLATELRGEAAGAAVPGAEFDPPWSTVNLGIIEGGTALNIIARTCSLVWEFRPLPGTDAPAIRTRVDDWIARELAPVLRQQAPEGTIETASVAAVPALVPEPGGLAESVALRLTGANRAESVSFTSEGGQFQECGISTVLCGPGSVTEAHQPNEFVAAEQLQACEVFLRRLADWACA